MYRRAEKPTFYFIGVTTSRSSIMKVFPEWAKYLELGDCEIRGIDFKPHDQPEAYREAVRFIKDDPLSLGALVTTHKIDLFAASRELFDQVEPYAELMGEVSCISKRNGRLWGHAKDPISSGLSLEAFLPADHWQTTGAEAFLMGAGGSSLALTWYLMQPERGENRPSKITVSNRSLPRLEAMRRIHRQIGSDMAMEYVHAPQPAENDAVLEKLQSCSLVVNATGLGKDAPGSPLSSKALFPEHSLVWDFNYRGDLLFLQQARSQKKERDLVIEDGWVYFIHGWTRVMAEVFHLDIPVEGGRFAELSEIAARFR